MSLDASPVAAMIEEELRRLGTPARAIAEKHYLKSDLEFLGASVGDIRSTVRALRMTTGDVDHDGLIALAHELWQKPVHERRMAAVVLLESYPRLLSIRDLPFIEALIRESKTWALVDGLAAKVAGTVLMRDPNAVAVTDRWAEDDDFWVRRSALLAWMKPLKQGATFDVFAGYADAMSEEKEFFIRKAIGWVLRETSKKRPDEVSAFVEHRTDRISGVSIREAVKNLEPADRTRLMAAYKARRGQSKAR